MNAEELRLALLAETEPAPGLAGRAFTDFPPPDRHRRWILGLAAATLTAGMVGALVATGGHLGWLPLPSTSTASQPVPVPVPGGPVLSGTLGGADVDVIAITPSGALWIVRNEPAQRPGPDQTLYESLDGGAHWVKRLVYSGVDVVPGHRLAFDPDGRGLLVGMNALYETNDGGLHWVKEPLPSSLGKHTWLQVLNGHEAMVVGADGTSAHSAVVIAHTVDGGRFWSVQASIDPVQAFGSNPVCASKGCGTAPPTTFTDSRHGIALGVPGPRTSSGIYVTSDGGRTWQPAALPGRVDPSQGMNIVAGEDGHDVVLITYDRPVNHLYVSTDGGGHWSSPRSIPSDWGFVGPPQLIALDDTHWWAGTQRGVWSSPDQGLHWYPAAALPVTVTKVDQMGFTDLQHGWVVAELPTTSVESVVLTTADGGRTWQQVPVPR